jgi:tRNA pseudouridine55 synthase
VTGILNIDKPAGWTSHDVVGKVRRLLGQKSVGHAGTLDPLATGVLLVCAGQATRVSEYLMAGRKVYRATVQLGLTTDTCDIEGAPIVTVPVPELTHADLAQALGAFVGELVQIPPAFSAIKQAGVPAYRRARRGETVTLAARRVTIHQIELLAWQPPLVTLDVTCDPGVYIRSLARDLGAALGCGGALAGLRRLRSGRFGVEDAISLDALAEASQAGQPDRCLHPLRAALYDLTPIIVDAEAAARLAHGQPIIGPAAPATAERYALTAEGSVVAILRRDVGCRDVARSANVSTTAPACQWWPKKVFETSQ